MSAPQGLTFQCAWGARENFYKICKDITIFLSFEHPSICEIGLKPILTRLFGDIHSNGGKNHPLRPFTFCISFRDKLISQRVLT